MCTEVATPMRACPPPRCCRRCRRCRRRCLYVKNASRSFLKFFVVAGKENVALPSSSIEFSNERNDAVRRGQFELNRIVESRRQNYTIVFAIHDPEGVHQFNFSILINCSLRGLLFIGIDAAGVKFGFVNAVASPNDSSKI